MVLSKTFRRNIIITLAITSIFVSADMCHASPTESFPVDTQVSVYSDVNANGKMDKGESPIPGALVTTELFFEKPNSPETNKIVDGIQDGTDLWMALLADENGQVTLRGQALEHYDIGVLKPCGYHAIHTPRREFSKNVAVYAVGYVPDKPQTGTSILEIHFWLDQDGNGKQSPGEKNVSNANIELWTTWAAQDDPSDEGGSIGYYFHLKTDSDGKIKLELGNVCDTFHVSNYTIQNMLSRSHLETTFLSPNVKAIDYENDQKIDLYEFDTKIGITSIEWGLHVTGSTK